MARTTDPKHILAERSAGWRDAVAGVPFSEHRSAAWKQGWTMHRRTIAQRLLTANDKEEIGILLNILGHTVRKLAAKGEISTDLARSAFDAALAGGDPAPQMIPEAAE